jgi:energy-coupling factor transporter ATP-binding protein EcfA2
LESAEESLLQIEHFSVEGLFGRLSHSIDFPTPKENSGAPSVVILYGRNGIGKTTVLRMLDGLLRLDFNIFRRIPFQSCLLQFDSGQRIEIIPNQEDRLTSLEVSYGNIRASLHPRKPGGVNEQEKQRVETFRNAFFRDTESVTFEFIDTERLQLQRNEDEAAEKALVLRSNVHPASIRGVRNPKAKFLELPYSLAERVSRFIREAQINYRAFFSTTEADLFPRIIARLTSEKPTAYETSEIRERFDKIHRYDKLNDRFGLGPDHWDYEQMMQALDQLSTQSGANRQYALTVLGSYVEQLESRVAERNLIADRLRTFERLMKHFWKDKSVAIHRRRGLEIRLESGELLEEKQLSSGEFHLLLLMVAALGTRRRGTIIAIDEPEMSMHIEWQRQLVPALVECASKADPLLIFATHSPDLSASLPQAMVELK